MAWTTWRHTRGLSDWSANEPPSAFIGYAGVLTGILIGSPLEASAAGFVGIFVAPVLFVRCGLARTIGPPRAELHGKLLRAV